MTFRKRSTNASSLPTQGTKPWLNGITLISSGSHDLDDIIGGGIPLGSSIFFEQDRFTNFSENLIQYFIAQGISVNQKIILINFEGTNNSLLDNLPMNLTLEQTKITSKNNLENTQTGSKSNDEKESEIEKKTNTELKVAWQYEKYLKSDKMVDGSKIRAAGGKQETSSSHYCQSFDLSRRIQNELIASNHPIILNCPHNWPHALTAIQSYFSHLFQMNEKASNKSIFRICLPNFGSSLYCPEIATTTERRLALLFILYMTRIIRDVSAVFMVSMPCYLFDFDFVRRVQHCFDTVLGLESFVSHETPIPDELGEFDGLFHIRRLQHLNVITPFRPDSSIFAIKRDRRKLHIEPLHLPPEGSRSTQTSHSDEMQTNEQTISKATIVCGTNARLSTSMDF